MKRLYQFSLLSSSIISHFITPWTEWVWFVSFSEKATHLCLANLFSTHKFFFPHQSFCCIEDRDIFKNQGVGNFGGGNKVIQNFTDVYLDRILSVILLEWKRQKPRKKSSHVFRSYEVYLLSMVFKVMRKHKGYFSYISLLC